MELEFGLIYSTKKLTADQEEVAETLYARGIDEPLVGISQPGVVALNYIFKSGCGFEQVLQAHRSVKDVMPELELIEATPDLVSACDIAEFFGISRQAVRVNAISRPSHPNPAHFGRPSLWRLLLVCDWYRENSSLNIAKNLHDAAKGAAFLNDRLSTTTQFDGA